MVTTTVSGSNKTEFKTNIYGIDNVGNVNMGSVGTTSSSYHHTDGRLGLRRGSSIIQGNYIAACVVDINNSSIPPLHHAHQHHQHPSSQAAHVCQPVYVYMHHNGSLALHTGTPAVEHTTTNTNSTTTTTTNNITIFNSLLWQSGKQNKIFFFVDFRAHVTVAGDLTILRGKKVVWTMTGDALRSHKDLNSYLTILE